MGNFDKIIRVLRFNRKPFTRISREARWGDGNILLCQYRCVIIDDQKSPTNNDVPVFSSQNTRDIKADRKAGSRTLAVLVGLQCACYVHAFLLLFPYVVIVLLAAAISPFIYIPLITLPYALHLSVACFEGEHFTLPQKIAVLDSAFGILYTFSVFWS